MCLQKIRLQGSLPLCPLNGMIVLGSILAPTANPVRWGMGDGGGQGLSTRGELQEVGGDSSSICAAVAPVHILPTGCCHSFQGTHLCMTVEYLSLLILYIEPSRSMKTIKKG